MRPVREDSRMPKGPMSFKKELILSGLADLGSVSVNHVVWISTAYTSTMQLDVLISKTLPPN